MRCFYEATRRVQDSSPPNYVCKLHKSLYRLNQEPRVGFDRLKNTSLFWGFRNSKSDTSFFIFHYLTGSICFLIYVNGDMIVTGMCSFFIIKFITQLDKHFSLKNLGLLSYFLNVQVIPIHLGLQLSQKKYIKELLFSNSNGNMQSQSNTSKYRHSTWQEFWQYIL